jgi:hypothetical protein
LTSNTDIIKPFKYLTNFYYLEKTGLYDIGNIILCVSSLYDNNILKIENKNPEKIYVSLYHGMINKSKLQLNFYLFLIRRRKKRAY